MIFTMKNKNILALVLALTLLVPLAGFAKDGGSDESQSDRNRDHVEDSIKDRIRDAVEIRREHSDDWSSAHDALEHAGRPEDRPTLRLALSRVFSDRFAGIGTGLQSLHDRIETWLTKEGDQIDATAAKQALDDAQTDIDLMKEKVAEIKVIFGEDIAEDDKVAKREEMKALLEEVKSLSKSAHESLKEAFRLIKSQTKISDTDDNSDDDIESNDDSQN